MQKSFIRNIFIKNFFLRKLIYSYEIFKINIMQQNKSSILGIAWSFIQPFIHIVTISFFFSFLLKQPSHIITMNLVGGLPLWNFFTSSLNICSYSIINRRYVFTKSIISKSIFVIADVHVQLYQMMVSFLAMYIAFSILNFQYFDIKFLLFPFYAIPCIVFVYSTSFAVAYLTPYIRDIPQMISIITNALYFTVPIIYPYSIIPESKRIFFEFHPLFLIIRPAQILILERTIPSSIVLLKASIVSVIALIFSYLIHKKFSRNIIFYL